MLLERLAATRTPVADPVPPMGGESLPDFPPTGGSGRDRGDRPGSSVRPGSTEGITPDGRAGHSPGEPAPVPRAAGRRGGGRGRGRGARARDRRRRAGGEGWWWRRCRAGAGRRGGRPGFPVEYVSVAGAAALGWHRRRNVADGVRCRLAGRLAQQRQPSRSGWGDGTRRRGWTAGGWWPAVPRAPARSARRPRRWSRPAARPRSRSAGATARAVNTTAGPRQPGPDHRERATAVGYVRPVRREQWGADDDGQHVDDDPRWGCAKRV